jgi:hypothetical protein
MMTSMGSSLKQLQSLEQEIRDKQKAVFQSEVDVQTAKLKLASQQDDLVRARQSRETAQNELNNVRGNLLSAQKDAEAAKESKLNVEAEVRLLTEKLSVERTKLADADRKLETTNKQVAEKRTELNQAVARLSEATGLINDIINLPSSPNRDVIQALRQKAQAFAPGIASFLRRFRDDRIARLSLDPSELAGLRFNDLNEEAEKLTGLHWYVSTEEGGSPFDNETPRRTVVIAAVPDDVRTADHLQAVLLIILSGDANGLVGIDLIEKLKSVNPTISSASIASAVAFGCWDFEDYNSPHCIKSLKTEVPQGV